MKKKIFALFLIVALVFTMVACGQDGDSQETETIKFLVTYENNPGEPLDLAANKWKELLEERSGGTMTIELFPASALGDKADVIDMMLAGEAVMCIGDGGFWADRGAPDMGIVMAPFVFESWEDCWALTASDWWAEQCAKLEENGLKIVSSDWIFGDRHLMTSKPVESVEDLAGMKIRIPNNTIQILGMEAIGATPTPMAWNETYSAVQQKVVDGLENVLPTLYAGKFHEVAKYLILDAHVKNFTNFVCGADVFNNLTPEQQEWLVSTGNEAAQYNNELTLQTAEDAIASLEAEGVTVIEPTEEVMEGFREAAQSFYEMPEIVEMWTPGLYETVQAAMGK